MTFESVENFCILIVTKKKFHNFFYDKLRKARIIKKIIGDEIMEVKPKNTIKNEETGEMKRKKNRKFNDAEKLGMNRNQNNSLLDTPL